MHMAFTKRTHIMLDPSTFNWLKSKSENRQVTIGSLVRTILEKERQVETDRIRQKRLQALQNMQKLRKQFVLKGTINYRELVEYGRKY